MGEEDLCRLCAESKSAADLLSIRDEYWIKQDLDTKISRFFQITISASDKLPKCVCSKCCEKVIITWEFNEKVQRAQETLRNSQIANLSDEDSGDYDSEPIVPVKCEKSSSPPVDLVECILSDSSQARSSNAFRFPHTYLLYNRD